MRLRLPLTIIIGGLSFIALTVLAITADPVTTNQNVIFPIVVGGLLIMAMAVLGARRRR